MITEKQVADIVQRAIASAADAGGLDRYAECRQVIEDLVHEVSAIHGEVAVSQVAVHSLLTVIEALTAFAVLSDVPESERMDSVVKWIKP